MNYRPLFVIFLGMLCLYAAIIPFSRTSAALPAGQDFPPTSLWLITDPDFEFAARELRVGFHPAQSQASLKPAPLAVFPAQLSEPGL
jgi:hypothetical protein